MGWGGGGGETKIKPKNFIKKKTDQKNFWGGGGGGGGETEMYPKNVINKKTEHQIQITKSCKNQNTTGLGRAASGKKTLSGPEGIAR